MFDIDHSFSSARELIDCFLDDNIFEGQHGKYEVNDDYVDGGELFDKNLPIDDIKNINAALEFGLMTRAAFGDEETVLNSPADAKPEEIAIVLYAAELAGCKSANPPANLDPAMKEKIDKAWEKMKNGQDAGLKNELDPTLATELTSTAQNKPQSMQLG